MTTERLTRATPADMEIRGDGRTVVGLCCPFGQPATVGGFQRYTETIRRGAFARTIAERGAGKVKFLAQHQHDALPLGRAELLREDARGLYGEFRVSKTVAGDEALELIRDGALDAMSIGFRPVRDQWSADRSRVERVEVRLFEVSAVAFPAYEGAQIQGVRSVDPPDLSRFDFTTPDLPEPVLCRAARFLPRKDLDPMNIRDMREKRASTWSQMQEVRHLADNDGWNQELREKWDRLQEQFDDQNRDIVHGDLENRFEKIETDPIVINPTGDGGDDPEVRKAFDAYLREGDDSMLRAQGTTVGSQGGYTVPDGFRNTITETLKSFGGVRRLAEVIPTDSGNDMPWPTNDDTGNTGAILAENTQASEQAVTFGGKTLGAYTYTSGMVPVSLQLLQDTGVDLESFLGRRLGQRIARAQAAHFLTGTGASQPQGLVTAATVGKTTASATAITYDELVDLVHSVDVAYLEGGEVGTGTGPAVPGVGWLMSSQVLAYLRKLRDDSGGAGVGRPLIEPSVQAGVPTSLLGYPIYVTAGMATSVAATNKTIAFGNVRAAYAIRDVGAPQVLRLVERFADYLQVGFLAWHRSDGLVQDSSAVKVLQQHA